MSASQEHQIYSPAGVRMW